MKKIILFFCCASIALNSFSQLSDSTIQYKGGDPLLQKTLVKNLRIDHAKAKDSTKPSRYFSILITISKAGEINKISISSFGGVLDSIETLNVLSVLKKTEGNWINHSKEEQIVVLPLYYLYADKDRDKVPDINQELYLKWKKVKLIYLSPLTVFVYPTMH